MAVVSHHRSPRRALGLLLFVASLAAVPASAFGLGKSHVTKTPEAVAIGRRALLDALAGTAAATTLAAVGVPPSANAAAPEFIGGPPMIRRWPGLEYLFPIYEMDNSLALLEAQLGKGAPGVALASNLVERFFKGGLVSNRNIYRGLCVVYGQEIEYDDPDRGRVRDHRASFLDDCDMTVGGMEAMRKPLRKLAEASAEEASPEVLSALSSAREGVRRFLSRAPPGDVDRIKAWLEAVKAADADRNGKVEGEELKSLSEDDARVYKAVSDLLG